MQEFTFNIPGIGRVVVEANSRAEARGKVAGRYPEFNESLIEDSFIQVGRPGDFGRQGGDTFIPAPEPILGSLGSTKPLSGETAAERAIRLATESGGDISNQLGTDIQAYPFATFANSLQNRGLDVNGPLGTTIRRAGEPLLNAANLGAVLGIPGAAAGNDPGDLSRWFDQNLGRSNEVATDLFNRLRDRNISPDSIALQGLRNPDFDPGSGTGGIANARAGTNLAQQASIAKYGGLAASAFNPGFDRLREAYERQLAQGQTPDFLNFAASQFGV